MLKYEQLHDYQKKAINHQCMHPNSMLWLDPGLGKTSVTLTSIKFLTQTGYLKAVLIVAPIRVCRMVWKQEAVKWEHTKDLTFSMIVGNRDQRTKALLRPANIYITNFENLQWLAETLDTYFIGKGKEIPFDGLVIDEISKMKNSTTKRVAAWKKLFPHWKWTTGLTGTPASNGYKDLHGQYLVIDGGQRLGTSKTAFKTRFYYKRGFKEFAFDDTESTIKNLIGDITLEMSAEDYNPLPDLIVNDVVVEFTPELRERYEQMEKDFFLRMDSGTEKEMFNQAALTNTCLQFSNGAVYPIAGMPLWEKIHDLKLDALEEIIDEVQGNPVLCSYAYRSDAERIMERFKHLRPINLTDCKSDKSLNDAMSRWATGDCVLMIGHPACLAPDTQVFTERNGWVDIVDVGPFDRVFDGIEFVSHDGCLYSGYKKVIDVFGIRMTPDHKLLIDDNWVEAKNVRNIENSRTRATVKRETLLQSIGEVPELWGTSGNVNAECKSEQCKKTDTLRKVYKGKISWYDSFPNLANLVGIEESGKRQIGQKLRWSWNKCMRKVGVIRELLRGHVGRLFGRTHNRTFGCKWSVLQRELCLGYEHGSAGQQAHKSVCCVSWGEDTPCGTCSQNRSEQDDVINEIESWDECGSSCYRCSEFTIREKSKDKEHDTERKSHVYDLVNCGPRHRFVIRNRNGEVFISHNSMGHGIDSLQRRGNTLVWFGLNWSLDLYEQFNARIRRQGQGKPVMCHRIITKDTLDQAQALALDDKATTQSSLRNAVKTYRQQKGV